jgi:RHH-type transcriptional regulator, proline utilization regulon repressor / proline dehydrogenase / delta 1-pyrroline-5-carboxylate dehydrogenase
LKPYSYLSAISAAANLPEADSYEFLLKKLHFSADDLAAIQMKAQSLITRAREQSPGILYRFLTRYGLNTPEGITLMSLAESLLRIPDNQTASELIEEKMRLYPLLARLGIPVVREGVALIGGQFVMGQDMASALKRAAKSYRYSYDMLGEAAKNAHDADRYFQAYVDAIHAIGKTTTSNVIDSPGISVKLSALHPRYQFSQVARLQKELVPKIIELATLAKQYQISLTVDAEEADKLQLSLILIEQVIASNELSGWDGFGLAVQAYQKAAPFVLDLCEDLAKKYKHRLMLRLVKGAYWDSEIKNAQVQGYDQYPVYTRKVATDVSYLVCAQKLLKNPQAFYPQFATHNAYTIAAVLQMTDKRDFEFQRLHGMGEALYDTLLSQEKVAARIYAPVGDYKHLLAYLVRRLLENGANSSFVNQVEDKNISMDALVKNPIEQLALIKKQHPLIPLPQDIYGDARKNSPGINWSDFVACEKVMHQLSRLDHHVHFDSHTDSDVNKALTIAENAFVPWMQQNVAHRAACLRKAADLFTEHQFKLIHLLIQEGKKTLFAAQGEVREAIDYCRYYAMQASILMATPESLPGPTGESNTLSLQGKGICVCISPWNFPLAIFTGQMVAALVSGNTVITKPAQQTPQIACYAVDLLHQAGIPKDVLQILIGKGSVIGDALMQDPRVSLVVFTGSTQTAQHINRTLAKRDGTLTTLIAETGGQNAMIVDSSALLEQVVSDAITSAFDSAGQRCSALRVLCIQEDIADACIEMLKGAMQELIVGSPDLINTDVGPVIDKAAQKSLQAYIDQIIRDEKLIYQVPLPENLTDDSFVAPIAIEISDLAILTKEVFGPVLHVYRYKRAQLPKLIAALNQTGYGLTLGIHSRITKTADSIINNTFVGNNYVNRNMIGAVVGVQPFGGQRLSGTGPKAGGPYYLLRMVTEKTVTINTTAIGGNTALLSLD